MQNQFIIRLMDRERIHILLIFVKRERAVTDRIYFFRWHAIFKIDHDNVRIIEVAGANVHIIRQFKSVCRGLNIFASRYNVANIVLLQDYILLITVSKFNYCWQQWVFCCFAFSFCFWKMQDPAQNEKCDWKWKLNTFCEVQA